MSEIIKTKRLTIYLAENKEMQDIINGLDDEDLKNAYSEMLDYCVKYPNERIWYGTWIIELNNGTRVGYLCFKGLNNDKVTEIGYGILEEYWNNGYATEAVKAVLEYIFKKYNVKQVEAETDVNNIASQRVLEKVGFRSLGINGEEGPRFYFDGTVIRLEQEKDYKIVEELVRNSFWNVYRPGCLEHFVLHTIRNNNDFVKELDFVLEKDGKIIGQNIFVKTVINCYDGKIIPVLTMGPISISPEYKRQGYGKKLLNFSIEKAKELGYKAVLIEGNIDFYGKCGFSYAKNYGIDYPDIDKDLETPFFLCNELEKGYLNNVKGIYKINEGYLINEEEAEEFDKNFAYKEKLKLPGQLV